ncbi:MAG: class I SAM-dependent DNA methyltransferase [Candidatus Binatia bacterium]
MTNARSLLETLTLPIADLLEQATPANANDGLVQWATFHGWDGDVNRRVVARQAALNLVLRALACHCLDASLLPKVAPADLILAKSDDLLKNLGVTSPPFSYLDDLAVQAGATIQMPDLAALATALKDEQSDVIGDVYASWVPQDARRTLGQFWTPRAIAQLMTQWAVQSPNDHVLDPASGSGVFLLVALDWLQHLGVKATSQRVTGVELSPLVFLMGLVNVLLHHPNAQPRLRWGDFLMPKREPHAVLKEPAAAYAVGVRQMPLPGLETVAPTTFSDQFDAIVCNPPYTRHHQLPEAYKSSWAAVMKQEYGIRLSRFSSLFAYFFVQATRMLAPTGRMAFITPAVVFEASYSRQIKAFIRQQLRLRAIVTFDETLSVFEGVDTAGCITLVEGPGTPAADTFTLIRVRQWPGPEPVLQAIERRDAVTADWGTSRKVDLAELEPRRKWTIIGLENGRFDDENFVPLSNIAHIMRGIATGANDFFVLSDSEVAEWGLKQANLRPVLTKTREVPGYVFNQTDFDRLRREEKKRWLLYLTEPVAAGTPEARYIQHGEARSLHERSLVKTRPFWYAMEQRNPAPIYFTYLSRKRSRFIYNQADVLALNVFLCIYPIPAISQDETMLKALLAILNSLIAKDSLRHVGRTYGSDTIKVEPREMDRLPVLNPIKLTANERKRLADLFDQLCRADSEEAEKAVRQAIDEAIAEVKFH